MGIFGKKKRTPSGGVPSSGESVSSNGSAFSGRAGPGAQSVAGNTSVFRVLVPENVNPGDEFQVYAGQRIVRVRCPPGTAPGQSLSITVPIEKTPAQDLPPDSPNVRPINDPNNNPNAPKAYMVTIPAGIVGGQQFPVTIQGQQLMVTCPLNARPGMSVRVVPPPPPTDVTRGPSYRPGPPPRQKKDDKSQLFEVEVPRGVRPGQPFALLAGGQRVLVTCPPNATPGQRIRFKLPLALLNRPKVTNEATKVRLKYDKDGWTRTVRLTDLKFQWVRMDDNGDIDMNKRFDMNRSAYVRKLEFRPGEDPRIRTGILSLVPATEAVVDSKIKSADGRDLVSYEDIADAQVKNFEDKADWFQRTCAQLCVEWNEGHMRMNVRRQFLLGDSVDAVMSLSRKDLRKLWRFEFIGEAGIDAGGLAREWFQLVTQECFDPDMGLWQSSAVNQMCMQINPASGTCLLLIKGTMPVISSQTVVFFVQSIAARTISYITDSWAASWARRCSIASLLPATWFSISTSIFSVGQLLFRILNESTRNTMPISSSWWTLPNLERIFPCFAWTLRPRRRSWDKRRKSSW